MTDTEFSCGHPIVWCRGCNDGVCDCDPGDDLQNQLCWCCVEYPPDSLRPPA